MKPELAEKIRSNLITQALIVVLCVTFSTNRSGQTQDMADLETLSGAVSTGGAVLERAVLALTMRGDTRGLLKWMDAPARPPIMGIIAIALASFLAPGVGNIFVFYIPPLAIAHLLGLLRLHSRKPSAIGLVVRERRQLVEHDEKDVGSGHQERKRR